LSSVKVATVLNPALPGGRIASPRIMAGVIALVAVLAAATNATDALHVMKYGFALEMAPSSTLFLRYLRETLVLVVAAHIAYVAAAARWQRVGSFLPGRLVTGAVVIVTVLSIKTLIMGYPLPMVIFGIKILALPLIYISLRWLAEVDALTMTRALASFLKPLFALEFVFAGYQILFSPPTFGATFAGSRPWGTFPVPNSLASASIAFAILLFAAKPSRWKWWFGVSLAVAFLTGSRTGSLGAALIFGGIAYIRFAGGHISLPLLRRRVSVRSMALFLGPVFVAGLVLVLSLKPFAGREITGFARSEMWSTAFAQLDAVSRVLGLAVGAGSNAAIGSYGSGLLGGAVTDSEFLSMYVSFGVAGLAICVWVMIAMWRNAPISAQAIQVPCILVFMLVYNIGEISPANMILVVSAGAVAHRAWLRV